MSTFRCIYFLSKQYKWKSLKAVSASTYIQSLLLQQGFWPFLPLNVFTAFGKSSHKTFWTWEASVEQKSLCSWILFILLGQHQLHNAPPSQTPSPLNLTSLALLFMIYTQKPNKARGIHLQDQPRSALKAPSVKHQQLPLHRALPATGKSE